jgi:hypothetical protein
MALSLLSVFTLTAGPSPELRRHLQSPCPSKRKGCAGRPRPRRAVLESWPIARLGQQLRLRVPVGGAATEDAEHPAPGSGPRDILSDLPCRGTIWRTAAARFLDGQSSRVWDVLRRISRPCADLGLCIPADWLSALLLRREGRRRVIGPDGFSCEPSAPRAGMGGRRGRTVGWLGRLGVSRTAISALAGLAALEPAESEEDSTLEEKRRRSHEPDRSHCF